MSHQNTARRPKWAAAVLLALSGVLIVTFVLLGNWQMRRLEWKQNLIASVDARAFAAEVDLPENFDPDQHSYLRVSASGRFLKGYRVLVKAVTELGPGYWAMAPLETDMGILWVNRGFVPSDQKTSENWSSPQDTVTGLLRASVEGGTLLERNDPASNRWVSRDTQAMSQAFHLGPTLPYFLEADHQGESSAWPRGGLVQVKFRNTHLAYALTWYALAILLTGAMIYVLWPKKVESE